MLNEEQRRHLRVRADLDRQEAESEQRAAENLEGYKMKFSEGARQDLEKLADYLSQPPSKLIADGNRREAIRFASLLKTLEKIAATDPISLKCAAYTNFFPEDPEHHLTAYIIDGEGTIHTVCQVVTDDHWFGAIEKLSQTPNVEEFEVRMQSLQELASNPVTTLWVTVPATELTPEFVEQGLRSWFSKYFPHLAEIQMNWLEEKDKQEFGKTLMAQEFLRRTLEKPEILDELLERLKKNSNQEES